jgi:hypothetical protein
MKNFAEGINDEHSAGKDGAYRDVLRILTNILNKRRAI